jgi:hypothetical protein
LPVDQLIFYDTTTRLTPKFPEDIREIAELTSDDHLLWVAELAEVPVSRLGLLVSRPRHPHEGLARAHGSHYRCQVVPCRLTPLSGDASMAEIR